MGIAHLPYADTNEYGEKYMGKAYAHRHDKKHNDFYATPKALMYALHRHHNLNQYSFLTDPCVGDGRIKEALDDIGWEGNFVGTDLYPQNGDVPVDYLQEKGETHGPIITNFPFHSWTEMVEHTIKNQNELITIGRVNYFGAYKRYETGIWNHLEKVLVFNRMVDYESPYRKDGKFRTGMLVTGWFFFKPYIVKTSVEVIDVQPWVVKKGEA